jgi:hypothetical protein
VQKYAAYLLLLPFVSTLHAQSESQPDNRRTFKVRPATAKPRPKQAYEQYIAYWTAEEGWDTELQLRNPDRRFDLRHSGPQVREWRRASVANLDRPRI